MGLYDMQVKMFVIFFCLVFLQTISLGDSTAEVKLEAKLPVNPVKQGGFLSVYCQIWNIKEEYKVTISRNLRSKRLQTEMLSWGPDVLGDERVLLALRTLEDGSAVYFLTILDVTREDEGTYVCKVRTLSGGEQIIGTSSVDVTINYFPGESSPTCSPGEPIVVTEGQEIVLNCSSTEGKPHVNFKWSKTPQHNRDSVLEDNVQSHDTHSLLTFKPSHRDDNAIFVCTISSPAFPQRSRTCHIGPITVHRDLSKQSVPSTTLLATQKVRETHPNVILPTQASSSSCSKVCSTWNTDVYYWIVSTVAFSIIAIIFIIVGFCLLVKYYKLSSSSVNTPQMRIYNDAEDTYEKLEYRNDRKVYMALDKSWVPTHGPIELQPHYNVTPIGQSSLPSQYHDMLT